MHTTMKRKPEREDTHDQEQYLTEYEPLIMERWAKPLLEQTPGYKILNADSIARSAHLDASCEVCCNPGTEEEAQKGQPTTDMYQCDVCYRTYHWKCLVQLQCCADEQRQDVLDNDN